MKTTQCTQLYIEFYLNRITDDCTWVKHTVEFYNKLNLNWIVIVVWKGIYYRSNTNRTGPWFILLLPQDGVLPKSVAGSDGVEPASGLSPKTVRLHAPCGPRCTPWATLLKRGLRFVQYWCTCNPVKDQYPICSWRNGIAQHQFAGD